MIWRDIPSADVLATAPAAEPILYATAKAFLRLPDDTDQTYVEALITAARIKVEQDTGRKLISQAWDLYADAFPDDAILLPWAPLVSVTSIKTTDEAGTQSTLAATNYQVDTASVPPRIYLSDSGSWPSSLRAHQAIVIRCAVGYGAAGSSVPGPLLRAMELAIALWYTTRTAAGSLLLPPKWLGYDALVQPYRLWGAV